MPLLVVCVLAVGASGARPSLRGRRHLSDLEMVSEDEAAALKVQEDAQREKAKAEAAEERRAEFLPCSPGEAGAWATTGVAGPVKEEEVAGMATARGPKAS